jgi:hypothetical protein
MPDAPPPSVSGPLTFDPHGHCARRPAGRLGGQRDSTLGRTPWASAKVLGDRFGGPWRRSALFVHRVRGPDRLDRKVLYEPGICGRDDNRGRCLRPSRGRRSLVRVADRPRDANPPPRGSASATPGTNRRPRGDSRSAREKSPRNTRSSEPRSRPCSPRSTTRSPIVG